MAMQMLEARENLGGSNGDGIGMSSVMCDTLPPSPSAHIIRQTSKSALGPLLNRTTQQGSKSPPDYRISRMSDRRGKNLLYSYTNVSRLECRDSRDVFRRAQVMASFITGLYAVRPKTILM